MDAVSLMRTSYAVLSYTLAEDGINGNLCTFLDFVIIKNRPQEKAVFGWTPYGLATRSGGVRERLEGVYIIMGGKLVQPVALAKAHSRGISAAPKTRGDEGGLVSRMDVDQSERKIFTAAYISSVGDLTDSINQQELYEIIVAAGKDLQRTDLNQRMKSGEEEINFSEAFHIYGNIARIDLEAIFERIDAQRSGHVQLNKLLTRLRKVFWRKLRYFLAISANCECLACPLTYLLNGIKIAELAAFQRWSARYCIAAVPSKILHCCTAIKGNDATMKHSQLFQRCDISEEEKEELCGYFVSMAERGSIPWRNDTYTEGSLFNDPVNEPD
ncbi:unnamed protein product [Toxocara canis]|uniref:EF-hand domain-containing protein n=1 Tax=Toxocara canis TaxID=6265 RepID=A0A183V1T0_TOXCA|nr:unnamed protein product [Toxocara canis]